MYTRVTTVERNFCTTCYERPPVLRDRFCWAEGVVAQYRFYCTVLVPAMGDPRRERPLDVYGHVINVPTHLNVKLPVIGGHLPNADSHLLVVCTCYNGQCKQMPRFRWSFQPKIARGADPKLRPTVRSNFHVAIW